MISESKTIKLPTLRFQSDRLDIRIDTGELLLPFIVLTFCIAYYYETQGLPEESLLYARPLLYSTVLLSIITIIGQAISLETDTDNKKGQTHKKTSRSVVWGVEKSVADKKHPQEKPSSTDHNVDRSPDSQPEKARTTYFDTQAAIWLVVLSIGYILSLRFVSFVFATVPFLAATVYLFGERSVLRVSVYSIGFTLLLWIVFVNWLLVPLPS